MGGNLAPVGSRLARGQGVVQTPPVLARYLNDLRMAEQAKALDRHFGRIPPEPGMFDDIALPADPIAAQRAVNAAPRTWLESAELADAMNVQPSAPLTDMLLDNEKRRALIASRLGRLTPEQQARSLPFVGQQYEADRAAARAAEIKAAKDRQTLAAMTALGAAGAGAFAGRVLQEADEQERLSPLVRDMRVADFIRSSADEIQLEDEPAPEFVFPRPTPPTFQDLVADMRAVPWLGRVNRPTGFLSEDPMMNLEPDSPDDAISAAPGPTIPVGRTMNIEDLPGPQMRSVRALMRAGIPSARAMDIIQGRANMSPDEYRMVTGGRR